MDLPCSPLNYLKKTQLFKRCLVESIQNSKHATNLSKSSNNKNKNVTKEVKYTDKDSVANCHKPNCKIITIV